MELEQGGNSRWYLLSYDQKDQHSYLKRAEKFPVLIFGVTRSGTTLFCFWWFLDPDLHGVVMNLVIIFFGFFGTRPFTLVVQYLFFCDFLVFYLLH